MKKYIALIGLMVLLNPVTAFAVDNLYVKAGAGFFNLQDAELKFDVPGAEFDAGERTSDMGFNLHAAIGKNFAGGFAVELEYGYNEAKRDKKEVVDDVTDTFIYTNAYGEASIKTLMINGLYNLENSSSFTPYAGIGLGLGFVELSNEQSFHHNTHNNTDTNFAFQLLAGVEVELSENFALISGYRYLNAGEVTQTYLDVESVSLDMNSHNFETSIKYSF